jgi:hypothetical protein
LEGGCSVVSCPHSHTAQLPLKFQSTAPQYCPSPLGFPLLDLADDPGPVGWDAHRQPLANRLIGDSHGALGGPDGASRRTPGALRARVAGGGYRSRGGGSLGAARARRQPARGQPRTGAGPSLRRGRGRGTSEPWRRAGCAHRACDPTPRATSATTPSAAATLRCVQSAH